MHTHTHTHTYTRTQQVAALSGGTRVVQPSHVVGSSAFDKAKGSWEDGRADPVTLGGNTNKDATYFAFHIRR